MQAPDNLWHQPDFLKLWTGQTLAQIAAQLTFLAIPLVATVTLQASALEMGMLTAVGSVPSLVMGLQTGAVLDRRRRRPVMVGADLGRALLLLAIPLAWWLDILSMPMLYGIAVLTGAMSLIFDVAYQALLASVVQREQLVDGNSKLELSRTVAEIVGPGLAGNLVQWLTAPVALVANAVLYLGSAITIWRITMPEPEIAAEQSTRSIWSDVREGLSVVWRSSELRPVVVGRGLLSLFNAMLEAVFVLYVVRVLGVSAGMLGIIFGIGGLGFLVGALLPVRVNARLGMGPATVFGLLLVGMSDLLVPLAERSGALVVPLLIGAQFFFGIGLTVFNVNQASFRQMVVAHRLQARASATVRFLVMALIPIGALLGGLFGEFVGPSTTLIIGASGELAAAEWLWLSPLRYVRDLTELTEG